MYSFVSGALGHKEDNSQGLCPWSEKDISQMADLPWQAITDRALALCATETKRSNSRENAGKQLANLREQTLVALREVCERLRNAPASPDWRLPSRTDALTSYTKARRSIDEGLQGYWLILSATIDELFASQKPASVIQEYLKTLFKRVLLEVYLTGSHHLSDFMFRDVVTFSANRLATQLRLEALLAQKSPFVLISADLNGFKAVNDTYGHAAGDSVLNVVAQRWQRLLRPSDWMGRWGGDEFVLILSNPLSAKAVVDFGNRIRQACEEPIALAEIDRVTVSSSYGYARYPEEGEDIEQILAVADQRLYLAKQFLAGGVDSSRVDISESTKWSERIQTALKTNRIDVYYQPILHNDVNVPFQWEALVRYRDINGQMHYPSEFLPVLPPDVVQQMDQAVIGRVFEDVNRWRSRNHRFRVAVNVHPSDLAATQWKTHLTRLHDEFPLVLPQDITFEVRESLTDKGGYHIMESLRHLQHQGYQIALDDFGTGTTPLHGLHKMPINSVKIDFTLTRQWGSDAGRRLIRSVIGLATSMGLSVIAEGIESQTQQDLLSQWGCQAGQGWLYTEAIPSAEVEGWTFPSHVVK